MRKGTGYKYIYAFAVLADLIVQFALEGVRAKFPSLAPPDALALIARDRRVVRGFAETDDTLVARLIRWLIDWRQAGGAYAILRQVKAYWTGYDGPMRIVSANGTWWTLNADDSVEKHVTLPTKNWNWDGHDELYARFWVILYASAMGITRDGTWGDGELWGATDGSTWGSTATPEQVQTVRGIVAARKSGISVCKNIIVSFDDAKFDPEAAPGAPLPDGTWANWSHLVLGVQVPARDPDAIYWDGTV